jgi:cobalt transporter subunit CbtA
MIVFRRLFFIALLAGVASGVVAAAVHQVAAVPIILEAEVYEKSSEAHGHPGVAHEHARHDHAAIEQVADATHGHASDGWGPQDGVERNAFTTLADILTGIGFALLLVAGYALKGDAVNWRKGLFWGLAGFATFTLAPTLGLPPELPGTQAAPLADRQLWWGATVVMTGGGLALLAFRREALWVVAAVALIALPHLLGAPQPAEHSGAAPDALAHRFILVATIGSLLFWLCLGASTGYLFQRFSPKD